jgi:hypothetical protein
MNVWSSPHHNSCLVPRRIQSVPAASPLSMVRYGQGLCSAVVIMDVAAHRTVLCFIRVRISDPKAPNWPIWSDKSCFRANLTGSFINCCIICTVLGHNLVCSSSENPEITQTQLDRTLTLPAAGCAFNDILTPWVSNTDNNELHMLHNSFRGSWPMR